MPPQHDQPSRTYHFRNLEKKLNALSEDVDKFLNSGPTPESGEKARQGQYSAFMTQAYIKQKETSFMGACKKFWAFFESDVLKSGASVTGERNSGKDEKTAAIRCLLFHAVDSVTLLQNCFSALPLGHSDSSRSHRAQIAEAILELNCGKGSTAAYLPSDRDKAKKLLDMIVDYICHCYEYDIVDLVMRVLTALDALLKTSDYYSDQLTLQSVVALIDVLPRCIEMVVGADLVCYTPLRGSRSAGSASGAKNTVDCTGRIFKKMVIEEMCKMRWPENYFNELSLMFKETPLDEDDLRLVCDLLFSRKLDKSKYANFLHDMLLLSNKGLKSHILKMLCNRFSHLMAELQKDETSSGYSADVFYNFEFLCRKDYEIGKTLIKILKDKSVDVNSFSLSLVILFGGVPAHADKAFAFVVKSFIDQWAASLHLPLAVKEHTSLYYIVDDARSTLNEIVNAVCYPGSNREFFEKPLIKLGFFMLESKEAAPSLPLPTDMLLVKPFSVHETGRKLLEDLFTKVYNTRNSIFTEALNRILTGQAGSIRHYLLLLQTISQPIEWKDHVRFTRETKCIWTDHYRYLEEVLVNLHLLSSDIAYGLLKGISPLFSDTKEVDKAILVLRKHLFTKTVPSTRAKALRGISMILCSKHFSGSDDDGDWMEDDEDYASNSRTAEVENDLVAFMHRSMKLDFETRKQLYSNFVKITRSNAHLREPIFYILDKHLQALLLPNKTFVQLKSLIRESDCVALDSAGHLIHCIYTILSEHAGEISFVREDFEDDIDEDDDAGGAPLFSQSMSQRTSRAKKSSSDSSALRSLKKSLERLLQTVQEDSKELDQCSLDKDASFSIKDESGRTNVLLAYQALGIYVSMLSFAAAKESESKADFAVEDVFQKYSTLKDMLTKKASKSSGKDSDNEDEEYEEAEDEEYDAEAKKKSKKKGKGKTKGKQKGKDKATGSKDDKAADSKETTKGKKSARPPQFNEKLYMPKLRISEIAKIVSAASKSMTLISDSKFLTFLSSLLAPHLTRLKSKGPSSVQKHKDSIQMLCYSLYTCFTSALKEENSHSDDMDEDDDDDSGKKKKGKGAKKNLSLDYLNLMFDFFDLLARNTCEKNEDVLEILPQTSSRGSEGKSLCSAMLWSIKEAKNTSILYVFLASRYFSLMSERAPSEISLVTGALQEVAKDNQFLTDAVAKQFPMAVTAFFDLLLRALAMDERDEGKHSMKEIKEITKHACYFVTKDHHTVKNLQIPGDGIATLLGLCHFVQRALGTVKWQFGTIGLLYKKKQDILDHQGSACWTKRYFEMTGVNRNTPGLYDDDYLAITSLTETINTRTKLVHDRLELIAEIIQKLVEYVPVIGSSEEPTTVAEARYRLEISSRTVSCIHDFMSLTVEFIKSKVVLILYEEKREKYAKSKSKEKKEEASDVVKDAKTVEKLAGYINTITNDFNSLMSHLFRSSRLIPRNIMMKFERLHPQVDQLSGEYERNISILSKKVGVNMLKNVMHHSVPMGKLADEHSRAGAATASKKKRGESSGVIEIKEESVSEDEASAASTKKKATAKKSTESAAAKKKRKRAEESSEESSSGGEDADDEEQPKAASKKKKQKTK